MSHKKLLIVEQETNSNDETGYFITPNTSIEFGQEKTSRFDSFDTHSKAYEKASTKITVRRYAIKQD